MKTNLVLALLATLAVAPTAFAQTEPQSPWLGRIRLLSLDPVDTSDPFTALGTNFAAGAVRVSNKTIPEIDISYFFKPNFALELVLTYPQRHNVSLAGVGKIGSIDHLPPSLLAQHHFVIPNSAFKPYVGLGVNFTRVTRARLAVGATPLQIERQSFGMVYQIGLDYSIGKNLLLNFDYKRIDLNVDVRAGGARLTTAELDPHLFGIGIGYRF